ncbi:MAG: hypothetical protein IPF79_04720 [Ignavibacteria bacterium]|nr:hypothetical protein [Ignavibacteria bacterium]
MSATHDRHCKVFPIPNADSVLMLDFANTHELTSGQRRLLLDFVSAYGAEAGIEAFLVETGLEFEEEPA